jgi:hypothetical protein
MAITLSEGGKQNYLVAGYIDVIRDCEWAVFDGKNMKAADEVPSIKLVEYQPVGDQFANRATRFLPQVVGGGGTGLDAYKQTYKADPTGNNYTFPYFTTEMRSKSNSWAQDTRIADIAKTAGGGLLSKAPELLQKLMVGAPQAAQVAADVFLGGSLGIEYPKMWQGSDAGATYSFDFFLFNTVSKEKIKDNWSLVHLLTHNNSYGRRNIVLQDAPVLYQVTIPGIRKSPVSAMKELKIEMVGQMRNLSNIISDRRVIIPEAYHISITMEDLFVESRQLLDPVRTNTSVVNVFTS